MKPTKYSNLDRNKIDLNTKQILKYPTPTKDMDISRMVVNGRHPENPSKYIFEKECSFVIYIISGKGKVYANDEIFEVETDDVVFIPSKTKFAVEGKFEYIHVGTPAFYPEQYSEIS